MASLDSLPTEVLFNICSFLEPKEVSNLSRVNKKLEAIHFDVLTSIDHLLYLDISMLTSAEVLNYISRYKNITSLNISVLAKRRHILQKNGRKVFASELATSCPKIDSFTVRGAVGTDLVMLYITRRDEKSSNGFNNSRATKGIKNLRVYPWNVDVFYEDDDSRRVPIWNTKKRRDFLRLSQRLRDVVEASTDFNRLCIEPMKGRIRHPDARNPHLTDCWDSIGKSIKGFVVSRAWTQHDADINSLTVLPSLRDLTSLSLSFLTVQEMNVITINNPGLKSFTCSSLEWSGFQHIQRLTQLVHLKIGINEDAGEEELPKVVIDDVFDAIGEPLLSIVFKFDKWNRSFQVISEKCPNLRSFKLSVRIFEDDDREAFKKSLNDQVDVSIGYDLGKGIWITHKSFDFIPSDRHPYE